MMIPVSCCFAYQNFGLISMILFAEIHVLTLTVSDFFNPEWLVRNGGLVLIMLVIFAQTGFFFCFFLPGGSLMFTAGVMVAAGSLNHSILTVCAALAFSSLAGTATGYWFGRSTGSLLYTRKDSVFFKKQYIVMAEAFFKKYGKLALTAGLFFPVIRTFAPIVAGAIRFNFSKFLLLTSSGSAAWVVAMILPGYLLGRIPFLKDYLTWIVIGIIIIVTIPSVMRIAREFRTFRKEAAQNENSD